MANTTSYIIDVVTTDKADLMEFLESAEGIMTVKDGGEYRECHGWSQVHIDALDAVWNLEQLDDLLYFGNHDIAGIVKA